MDEWKGRQPINISLSNHIWAEIEAKNVTTIIHYPNYFCVQCHNTMKICQIKCCILKSSEMSLPCCIQANPELTAVWAVGQRIWQRDFPGIYTAIAALQWSENILPVMEALRGNNKKTCPSDHSLIILTCIEVLRFSTHPNNIYEIYTLISRETAGIFPVGLLRGIQYLHSVI